MTRDAGGRPRVVMFLSNPFETDSRVLKEARSATAAGFDVTILATPKDGLAGREDRDGFCVVRLGRRYDVGPVRRFIWYAQCVAYCLRRRPRIIHVNDFDPLPAGWVAARLTRAGLVYDSHELWSQGRAISSRGPFMHWLVRKLERFFASRTDANFQADTSRAEFFARQYRLPQPGTLSNCPTLQDTPRTDRLRQMAGLTAGDRIMVYSGSIGPGRGVEPTLQSLDYLPENVHMVFLGYGYTLPVTEFQKSSPQGWRVHIVPPVPYDEVVATVGSADVGLSLIQNTNLSYYLGAPNKLFEYMMAGVPVVASDHPEIATVVRDVDFGLLVDPEDPRQIAEAVMKILDDPALAERFRANALRGRAKYCWENQVTVLLDAYRRIVHQALELERTP